MKQNAIVVKNAPANIKFFILLLARRNISKGFLLLVQKMIKKFHNTEPATEF